MRKSIFFRKGVFACLFAMTFALLFTGVQVQAAEPIEITNEKLADAKADPGTAVDGITYQSSNEYYFASGDYVFGEDITGSDYFSFYFNDGDFKLDLNGKTITAYAQFEINNSTLILDGNGTIESGLQITGNSNVTIKSGTFNGNIKSTSSKLLIENATVNNEWGEAITIAGTNGEVEIWDGTFTSAEDSGAAAFRVEADSVKSLIIKGGIFTGDDYGFRSDNATYETVYLKGGTYKGIKDAAIYFSRGTEEAANSILMDILYDGYVYLPEIETVVEYDSGDYIAKTNIKETSVVPVKHKVTFKANGGSGEMADVTGLTGEYTLPESEFEAPTGKQFKGWSLTEDGEIITTLEMTEDKVVYAIWEDAKSSKNPKTGDILISYILSLGLSIICIALAIKLNTKKNNI